VSAAVALGLLAGAAPFRLPHLDYLALLPELIMLGGAAVLLAAASLVRRPMPSVVATAWSGALAVAALAASLVQWQKTTAHGPKVAFAGAVAYDGFAAFVNVVVSAAVLMSALAGHSWLEGMRERDEQRGPELQVLLLSSASGAMLMGSANDLIVVFLGLEVMSIALYVLAALDHRRETSGEASLKYFVLGAFSSAVFVYGIALAYGATGTTNLTGIADYLAKNALVHDGVLLAGLGLMLVGLGFKVAAVPFHLWTPDVYQGSPTFATGFMAAVAKVGGFGGLVRVLLVALGVMRTDWQPAIAVLAVLTLGLGALVALVQQDVKRMLAYSSINHAGFVLVGVQAATARGASGALYYLFVYAFMAIGSFACVALVAGPDDEAHGLEQYRGLAARRPWLAATFGLFLVAQAGVPFTTGFFAKLEVIAPSIAAGSTWLAAVAMVSAAVAAFFYLRVLLVMYLPGLVVGSPLEVAGVGVRVPVAAGVVASTSTTEQVVADEARPLAPALRAQDRAVVAVIAVSAAVTVVFGIWPAPLLDFASRAHLLFVG
jgi:NADH-quinone oxidoreductase subunit N